MEKSKARVMDFFYAFLTEHITVQQSDSLIFQGLSLALSLSLICPYSCLTLGLPFSFAPFHTAPLSCSLLSLLASPPLLSSLPSHSLHPLFLAHRSLLPLRFPLNVFLPFTYFFLPTPSPFPCLSCPLLPQTPFLFLFLIINYFLPLSIPLASLPLSTISLL